MSDREREVTEMVSEWITSDGDYFYQAKELAETWPDALGVYLAAVLGDALGGSAPWHVAQELAPNDYRRVDWAVIAEDLT